ncbi:MAG: hypothetical protein KBC62_03245 [Candidatus Pacebacteria bacterium]|nr:hypothetical protein [Candidatus Paceibacterota bacterium]MBP9842996.1 hypothetical protein [Candidatus Paceibacterota bacterium]
MTLAKRLGMALFLSCSFTATALAQQSPTSTWNDTATFRDPLERSVDIQRAEAQKRARSGGYGPAQFSTTYEGDVTFNESNQYSGPVTSNTATTATNLNSFSSSVRQEGSGNAAGVTFTTGSTAHNTSQSASATSAHSGSGSASNGINLTSD